MGKKRSKKLWLVIILILISHSYSIFVLSNRDAFKRNIFNAKIKISMVPLLTEIFLRVV